jgi:hypothetical protein
MNAESINAEHSAHDVKNDKAMKRSDVITEKPTKGEKYEQ